MLLRGNSELVVEGVMPDLLHVVPVGNNAVLNGVLQGQDTPLGLGLVPDVGILLPHSHHHSLMSRPSNDGWEDSSWSVITSKASLAHSGAIADHQSCNLVVTHFC